MVKSVPLSASSTSRSAMSFRGRVLRWLTSSNAAYILSAITQAARFLDTHSPFSYSKVCKTPLSGQLFLLHCGLPSHGTLWIGPPVSVSHPLHRRFNVIGRSHYPGRPPLSRKVAKHVVCKLCQVQGSIQIAIDHQPTGQTLIGAMLERHPFFDMPAT